MKMIYGGKPVKSMKAHVFDVNSNDATMIASDLQAGVSAYAKGKKVIGTGKSFEFARYGSFYTNFPIPVSNVINIIEISSTTYPIVMNKKIIDINNLDFSISQIIGNIVVDGINYAISAIVENNMLTISCDKNVSLEVFYGKDNYV